MFGFDHFFNRQPLIVDKLTAVNVFDNGCLGRKVAGSDENIADAVLANVRFDQAGATIQSKPVGCVCCRFKSLAGKAFRQEFFSVGQPARRKNAPANFASRCNRGSITVRASAIRAG